ncbi:hypothetical protein HAALTHF_41410n [Vreelandella aquamarina]|nr:hypothetical protein HAALTHF_41410n [Halomonas axialensis]
MDEHAQLPAPAVLTFLDPDSDPLGSGWNIIQSTTAIGSGGLWGKGWLEGTQSQLEFLPERHTDFIIAVLGEEFGLVGMLLLLTLYIMIVGRGLWLASSSQDTFGRLFAGSIIPDVFYLCICQCGYGERHFAGGGRAAATGQLWRHL